MVGASIQTSMYTLALGNCINLGRSLGRSVGIVILSAGGLRLLPQGDRKQTNEDL